MRARHALLCFVSLGSLSFVGSASARLYEHLFASGFDIPVDAPGSDAEAARFLTQASFGPTPSEIARLRGIGYNEWIDQQLAARTTLVRPFVESVVAARTAAGQNVSQNHRVDRWFWIAAYADDQLRQRMAFALSEIFVISDQGSAISNNYIPMAEYADVLGHDAFKPYRTLLTDVTYNPSMGKFLSHFRNQKPGTTTQPDENYAREIMQLFSVGLVQLNMDASPVLQAGNPVATYDQTTITHTAKVFTGLTYSDAPTNPANFYGGAVTNAGTYNPMACWGTELFASTSSNMRHDLTGDDGTTATAKTVLGGLTIPAGQSCADDVSDELDIIAGHVNVAPFVSRQLIQRFVTSNPSPEYIERVATVFEDNGTPAHERGDLGSVLKAILLDPEARAAPVDASAGKLREPLLRITALWRAWGARAPAANAYGEVIMSAGISFLSSTGQKPLGAPTVFNFYEPDYQQPGPFADQDLYSPELQIHNETTAYTTGNVFYSYTRKAYVGMNLPPDNQTLPTDRPLLDLAPLVALVATPSAMVDLANARMMYGTMSPTMRSTLINMVQFMSGASPQEKAWSLIYLISLSPEFAAQR
ncbi:MAG: DUF1800 family protein [Dokdonella sp.]|uniref:DUF1800 domain-containing protein n=1 Tax=Dokdonella sp. TaxID=2291710 RepID=UPI0032655379